MGAKGGRHVIQELPTLTMLVMTRGQQLNRSGYPIDLHVTVCCDKGNTAKSQPTD